MWPSCSIRTWYRLNSLPLLALAALSCAPADEPRTRLVLVTLDTLRYDSFAGRAGADGDMPATRAFASRGLRFEQAYSSTSSTQPTHASLFTGLHPWEHGVTRNGVVLGDEHETLAELLSAAGYETSAVVASFPLHRMFGYDQGFDRFQDAFTRSLQARDEWRGFEVEGRDFYSLADFVTERALAELDAATGPRQFFWFHYFDAHSPYGDTQARTRRKGAGRTSDEEPDYAAIRELYDADVRYLDQSLQQLYERLLEDADRYETHVVITADHGESFGEEGAFGHETRVTEEQVRVPLVVVSPRAEAGVRDAPNGSVDVFATLLALVGLGRPAGTHGADLTAGEVVGAPLGMRRSFERDGTEPGPGRDARFFVVHERALLAGNSKRVFLNTSPYPEVDEGLAEELKARFAEFERLAEENLGRTSSDPDAREGLSALGYTE